MCWFIAPSYLHYSAQNTWRMPYYQFINLSSVHLFLLQSVYVSFFKLCFGLVVLCVENTNNLAQHLSGFSWLLRDFCVYILYWVNVLCARIVLTSIVYIWLNCHRPVYWASSLTGWGRWWCWMKCADRFRIECVVGGGCISNRVLDGTVLSSGKRVLNLKPSSHQVVLPPNCCDQNTFFGNSEKDFQQNHLTTTKYYQNHTNGVVQVVWRFGE